MTSVRAALALSFVERYALIVLALLSYVLIARLLTPSEIGIYSVTAALIGIAQVIREFGVGSYLIQEKDLTQQQLDTALTLLVLSGAAMYLGVMLAAPWIASFYGEQQVASILRITCLNFLILPFCSFALSVLRRMMRFDRLLVVNLVGALVGLVATVCLAMLGFGPRSLAWGTVACNVATAGSAWIALPQENRPRRPRLIAWRSLAAYGRKSTFANVAVSAAIDINDLVVGRVLGFAAVAMLSRAMGLMNIFHRDLMGAAKNVAFPAFAAAYRDGKPLEAMFVYSVGVVTCVGWPFYGFLALFPLEALHLLAGKQWNAAAPLVPVFAAAGAIITTATLTLTVVLAVGRVDLASRADMIVSALRVFSAAAAALIFKDLMSIAMGFLLSFAFAVPIFFAFKQRCLPNDWSALFRQATRSIAVTALTLLVPALLSFAVGIERTEPLPTYVFLLTCLLTFLTWALAISYCGHAMSKDPLYLRLASRLGLSATIRNS